MHTYENPIIKGFYPDPSICRVEDDYYLVTSTFSYFPGVPIFHSKDLVNWEQIGNILDRPSQLPLANGEHSHGIFAPTIRYHQGIFYMITTNVTFGENFIVRADNPQGPWSKPYWLEAEGIDPSLFFDDDGRCWYTGTKDRREGGKFWGDNEIFLQELDLETMKLIGESYPIWHGAMVNAEWAEGPHLYKKDGWYYLLISEGGTGHEHALTIARSKKITDYFEGYKSNPILTHRHLGRDYPIVNVGHGDIVQTQKDEWWMVCLASRPYGGYYRNLGRETFLVPLIWEEGWPVINPGKGILPQSHKAPDLEEYLVPKFPEKEDFEKENLSHEWIYLRNPNFSDYDLKKRLGWMTMTLSTDQLNSLKSPSMICRRQQSMDFIVETRLDCRPRPGDRAGLTLYQNNNFYFTIELICGDENIILQVVRCMKGKEEIITQEIMASDDSVWDLKVQGIGQDLTFSGKAASDKSYTIIAENMDGRILSTDVAGGFVGTVFGLFGITSSESEKNHVAFDWFKLIDMDEEKKKKDE